MAQPSNERIVDRYAIYDQIAAGGMAVVHFGRLLGQAGFSRIVAIKRLHPQFAADPEFVAMFLDEARLAVRVQHPNVVAPLDIVVEGNELLVVMEYVSGETLAQLVRLPAQYHSAPPIICTVLADVLQGLHAAHEARAEDGTALNIVHRDVSPQNIIVGVDGVARVLDFGVAKAAMRSQATKDGEIKGKISYMAPEQLKARPVDRRADIFAAGVVLWESLAGRRLFRGEDLGQTVERVLHAEVPAPSAANPAVSPELDAVVMRALERDPDRRFPTAREFAIALRAATPLASPGEVADWVRSVGGTKLAERIQRVAAIESYSSSRVRVTGRSPLHTPLGLFAMPGADARISSPDAPTVRPGSPVPESASTESAATLSAPLLVAQQRRKKILIAAGALAGLSIAIICIALWGGSSPQTKSPSASTSALRVPESPALVATARVTAPETTATPAAPNVVVDASPAPSVTGASSSAKAVAAKHAAKAGAAKTTSSPAAPPTRKATAAATNCNPPYVVDAKGIRRIKPECL